MNRRVPNGTHGGVEGGLITRPSDRLVQDEVIGLGDLSDFSEDVQERVKFMVQRW